MPLPSVLRAPISARLRDAILSLQPTAYWPLDDSGSPLRDIARGWSATVTGSPTYSVAAPNPIGKGITFSGSGQYATSSGSVPTPTASVSVLAVWWTTDASASVRVIAGRAAASQFSWDMRLSTVNGLQFVAQQSGGLSHCSTGGQGATTNSNGQPHLSVGSFDGTEARCGLDSAATATSTGLTGSWHTASTAGVGIAHRNAGSLFPGTIAHVAYWADRVITDAERLWLYSIMAGG